MSNGLQAQKLSKYYSSSKQESGTLYFIEAQKEFTTTEGDDFIYDLTYLTTNDSLILNFTFHNEEIIDAEQLTLQTSFISTTAAVKKVFVKDDRRDWEHRYTGKFSFEALQKFYRGKEASIIIKTKEHGQIKIHPKSRKWKKQASVFSKIFDMIIANQSVD